MRKLVVLAIILSLGIVGQCYAGYNVKPRVDKVTGTGQLQKGFMNVKMINFYSSTAGDTIGVYNHDGVGQKTPNELEFDIGISANNSSQPLNCGVDGLGFSGGVYISSSNPSSITSVEYDY